MVTPGVILMACTAAVLFAEFFRRRTRPFPAYGWFGLAFLAVAEWLMFRAVEPVLQEYPLCRGARVTIRQDDQERRIVLS